MEVAKHINDSLYPELRNSTSLPEALNTALQECHSPLLATRSEGAFPVIYARVAKDSRSCQIYIAAHERLFLFGIWNQGVMYGGGSSESLLQIAQAIHFWVAEESTISQMEEKFDYVNFEEQGRAHEAGTLVDWQWQELLERWKKSNGNEAAGVVELIEAASRRPELRQLFPYTSLAHLCFSRTTGYPFASNCPFALPIGDGLFRAYSPKYTLVKKKYGEQEWNQAVHEVLGEGNVEQVLDLIVANLPTNFGPAVAGTAEGLEGEE